MTDDRKEMGGDIPAIAAQLSEAQRRAVMACDAQWFRLGKLRQTANSLLYPTLNRPPLVERGGQALIALFRLTPLGLAVRAHLEEQADG